MFRFTLTTCIALGLVAWASLAGRAGKSVRPSAATAWTAAWSHDDRYVAVGNDQGALAIYETKGWKKVKGWRYPAGTFTRVEWSPTDLVLAVASVFHEKTDSIVQLYDLAGDRVLKWSSGQLQGRALTWKPDGGQVAFVGAAGSIHIFSKEGAHLKTLSFRNLRSLFEIDWHPEKNLLLAVEDDIYLIDADRDLLLATYDDGSENKGILCCQWHPSGKFFVTGDYGHEHEGGEPSYLKYWSPDGKLLRRMSESKYEFRNARWSRDGKYLAASGDAQLVFNEAGDLVSKTKFDHNNLWGIGWNSRGDQIITSDQAGNIRVTDIRGKILKTFTL